MNCRFCKSKKSKNILNYENLPISNELIKKSDIKKTKFYTLKIFVCKNCWLVQTKDTVNEKKIFNRNYVYYSSYSKFWLKHCKKLSNEISKKIKFNNDEYLCEIASNDGYFLDYFKRKKINCFGVEPSLSVAKISKKKKIKTYVNFFTHKFSKQLKKKYNVKLIVALNVIAHVPNLNDVLKGIYNLLNENGIVIFEFPYLKNLIEKVQFDTIYHEHFSYFSFFSFNKILNANGLKVFNVKQVSSHGGSLRIYATKKSSTTKVGELVNNLLKNETKNKINSLEFYDDFKAEIQSIKIQLRKILLKINKETENVYGYGAASKCTVLLNLFKINSQFLKGVFDKNKFKINKLIPGVNVPIIEYKKISKIKPKYIVIFPWNLNNEIIKQLKFTRKWGCKLIIFKHKKYIII